MHRVRIPVYVNACLFSADLEGTGFEGVVEFPGCQACPSMEWGVTAEPQRKKHEAKGVYVMYPHILPLPFQVHSPWFPPCSVPRRLPVWTYLSPSSLGRHWKEWGGREGRKKSVYSFLQLLPCWESVVCAPLPRATVPVQSPLHTALPGGQQLPFPRPSGPGVEVTPHIPC